MRITSLVIAATVLLIQCTNNEQQSRADTGKTSRSGMCGPALTGSYLTDKKAPVFQGLDYFKFPVTTESSEAQKYVDQGWALAAGFNHIEAARSFYWATQEDPDCAMCYWGLAYVLGPNYNAGMDPEVVSDAVAAIQQAKLLSSDCTERERDLIDAMAKRYPTKVVDDRTPFDQAYAEALGKLHEKYPEDHDIAAMYAEAMMDIHPWDLWDKNGEAKPWTPEILRVLRQVRQEDPNHVISNHLYIHAVEASHEPEIGNESATLLSGMVPGSGHLVHMPSHIYIRTGDYKTCTDVNTKAVEVDSIYVSACHAAGVYPLAYYPHNFHFICACAALEGNGELALEASFRMQEKLDTNAMRMDGLQAIQHFYTIPYYIMVKFHMWDEILAVEEPAEDLIYPRAIVHYARGMALAHQKQEREARAELGQLHTLAKDTSLSGFKIWDINSAADILQIAQNVLEGEILLNSGKAKESTAFFKKAVEIEDALNYNEPPDWFFSVRHHLGNALLAQGKWNEAEEVYRKDLFNFPNNGWALNGLHMALLKQGKNDEAKEVEAQMSEAWERADVKLEGSKVL